MHSLAEQIYETVSPLPQSVAREVLDFANFVSQRHQSQHNIQTVGTLKREKEKMTSNYQQWLEQEVQEALNDPAPSIPHAVVMAEMNQRLAVINSPASRRKRA